MRTVSGDRLRDVFWLDSTNRATCDNMLARIRKLLGPNIGGEARVSYDRSIGRHVVHDDIGVTGTAWTSCHSRGGMLRPDEVQILASAG